MKGRVISEALKRRDNGFLQKSNKPSKPSKPNKRNKQDKPNEPKKLKELKKLRKLVFYMGFLYGCFYMGCTNGIFLID